MESQGLFFINREFLSDSLSSRSIPSLQSSKHIRRVTWSNFVDLLSTDPPIAEGSLRLSVVEHLSKRLICQNGLVRAQDRQEVG